MYFKHQAEVQEPGKKSFLETQTQTSSDVSFWFNPVETEEDLKPIQQPNKITDFKVREQIFALGGGSMTKGGFYRVTGLSVHGVKHFAFWLKSPSIFSRLNRGTRWDFLPVFA